MICLFGSGSEAGWWACALIDAIGPAPMRVIFEIFHSDAAKGLRESLGTALPVAAARRDAVVNLRARKSRNKHG